MYVFVPSIMPWIVAKIFDAHCMTFIMSTNMILLCI